MQETKTRTPADEVPSSRPPWIRAVAIAAAVALLGGVLYATWQGVAGDDPEPDPIGLDESEPDFSLTDEQAIARFEELRSSGLRAVESRDVTLLPAVYTSDSPMGQRAREAIENLREDSIVDKTSFETIDIQVLSSTPTTIELQEISRVYPCFKSDSGKDVTEGPRAFEWTVSWTLQIENDRWLIYNSVAQEDRKLNGQTDRC